MVIAGENLTEAERETSRLAIFANLLFDVAVDRDALYKGLGKGREEDMW